MRFVWDEAKRQQNLRPEPDGHGLDFADARDRFDFDTAVIVPTYAGKSGASRFLVVGYLDGRLCALVMSPLGTEAMSIISLRPASRKEKRSYDEAST
ncbi:TPA: BrnT family toxin [Klebsiella pneumoniae]